MTDDQVLAAEYALGLLEGEALMAARAKVASDSAFAAEVERWNLQLAPLADTIPPRTPRSEIWERIRAELASSPIDGEVVALRRRVRRWQWIGGLSAAAAIALAFVALLPQTPAPGPGTGTASDPIAQRPGGTAAKLAANMPIEGTALSLDLTYLPAESSLLVGAVGLSADGVHDHEIWFVPEEGDPVSLGVVTPGKVVAHTVPSGVVDEVHEGSRLLLSREPLGGKPADAAVGPVVAEARFTTI